MMTFLGCGNSCSRHLPAVKTYLADLCACVKAADRDHPIGVSFQDWTLYVRREEEAFQLSGLFHLISGCLEICRDQRGPDNRDSTVCRSLMTAE